MINCKKHKTDVSCCQILWRLVRLPTTLFSLAWDDAPPIDTLLPWYVSSFAYMTEPIAESLCRFRLELHRHIRSELISKDFFSLSNAAASDANLDS
jgi:hypothetical protein